MSSDDSVGDYWGVMVSLDIGRSGVFMTVSVGGGRPIRISALSSPMDGLGASICPHVFLCCRKSKYKGFPQSLLVGLGPPIFSSWGVSDPLLVMVGLGLLGCLYHRWGRGGIQLGSRIGVGGWAWSERCKSCAGG